jgi:hypothetical protein
VGSATPGVTASGGSFGCYVSEVSDAPAFANEFVELHCDRAP